MTKNYYEANSIDFINGTIDCDMFEQHSLFLKYLPKKAKILDLGFGSGRDMIYFSSINHKVFGIDPVEDFVSNMRLKGFEVYKQTIEDITFNKTVDGIWACASLLHSHDLKQAFKNCDSLLSKNGIMYASFKYGDFIGERAGRFFIDLNENSIKDYIEETSFKIVEIKITLDVRKDNNGKWLNLILIKE